MTINEICPRCGEASEVREKLLLIDEAWIPTPDIDPRLKYASNMRVNYVDLKNRRAEPLEQFVNGYYCDHCDKGFISETVLNLTQDELSWIRSLSLSR